MKLLLFALVLLCMPVGAQPTHQPYPRDGWRDTLPSWCRHYDRRDYRRELRACDDRRCRIRVMAKGRRCGHE